MASLLAAAEPEHLTPHDLVTYSRCPHEMDLIHRWRAVEHGESPSAEPVKRAEMHSPLLPPPIGHLKVYEGRIDLDPSTILVYLDEHERGLPLLFPPERVRPDPRLRVHGANLVDTELRLSGRPDFVVRLPDGTPVPVEYKSTHLFNGRLGWHGRTFDVIQAIAECRLVDAVLGERPPRGIVLYGDSAGHGDHEGWMEVEYTEAEERWLRYALAGIRSDDRRPPVPVDRHCAPCEANRDGHCRYAAVRFGQDLNAGSMAETLRRPDARFRQWPSAERLNR